MTAPAPELAVQRDLTHAFIVANPTTITLTSHTEVKLPSGGFKAGPGIPRIPQVFKLIQMNHTERPKQAITALASGVQRKYDFTLLGEWNAVVAKGDWWDDANGQRWVIDDIVPYNGYEVKAMVMSYGGRPDHA